jgi:hypothetical protein
MLSTTQIANIIFNETQSPSGNGIDKARVNIAMTIHNAQKTQKHLPMMAAITANVPVAVKAIYAQCLAAAQTAAVNDRNGTDPTNGATNFNFRSSLSTEPFFGLKLYNQTGPSKTLILRPTVQPPESMLTPTENKPCCAQSICGSLLPLLA